MSEKYIELKKENLIFDGKTEKEKKINETIYDLCLENDALYEENKELKKTLKGTTHCFDKEEHQRLIKENEEVKKYCCKRNECGGRLKENHKLTDSEILIEFEKWVQNRIETDNKLIDVEEDEDNRGYILARKFMLEECLDKLQELKKENDN